MCQQDNTHTTSPPPKQAPNDPFPWHLGAYDAHCHPTDTMASLSPSSIAALRTRVLAIMATRSQDQQLVAEVAAEHGIKDTEPDSEADSSAKSCKVVPAFGWHPWFSYQLYDDAVPNPTYNYSPSSTDDRDSSASEEEDARINHYRAVLSPTPEDRSFLSSLPTPTPLSSLISSTREYLAKFPLAMVGEVGLDKGFRLPQQRPLDDDYSRDESITPGGREGRLLSPFRVQMQHQQAVLQAQLRLAGEMGRAVSVHGVQAHGVLYDTIAACWKGHEKKVLSRRDKKRIAPGAEESSDEDADEEASSSNDGSKAKKKKNVGGKPFPPRICLHSYSGSADMLKQWFHPSVPSTIFASFSTGVNMGNAGGKDKLAAVVRAVPDDRVLVESDMHAAGEEAEGLLEEMYRFVCEVKGWGLEKGVERIGGNFQRFVYG
ncbi:TatD family [Trichoderma gracile]